MQKKNNTTPQKTKTAFCTAPRGRKPSDTQQKKSVQRSSYRRNSRTKVHQKFKKIAIRKKKPAFFYN